MGEEQQADPRQSSGLRVTITQSAEPDGGVVLTVTGSLDYYSANEFVAKVQQALACGGRVVTADLVGVQFSDSSGLAALVRAHKDAQRAGRRFVIRDPELNLRRILAITCLDSVLEIELSAPAD